MRQRIHAALGDARIVVNVGAGTGSYEPSDRYVIAIKPSDVMAAQRSRRLVPALRETAATLPLRDTAADAAMAVLTIHHWDGERERERERGVREMRRVSRGPVVILTYDPEIGGALTYNPEISGAMWLMAEYLPEIAALDHAISPRLQQSRRGSAATSRSSRFTIPRDCQDWMLGSFWAHPERVLDADARNATSGFARMAPEVVGRAVAEVGRDLASGAWYARHGALLDLDEFDVGLRLVVAR